MVARESLGEGFTEEETLSKDPERLSEWTEWIIQRRKVPAEGRAGKGPGRESTSSVRGAVRRPAWGGGDRTPDSMGPVHGVFQARILEWVAISSSRGSSWPRDRTSISCTGREILYHWATWEACMCVYIYIYTIPPSIFGISSWKLVCTNICALVFELKCMKFIPRGSESQNIRMSDIYILAIW